MKNYIVNIVNIEYDIDELEDGKEMPVLPTFLSMDVSVVSDEEIGRASCRERV